MPACLPVAPQVAGLKEAEPELYRSIDAAMVTIAANAGAVAAAAESVAAAKAAEVAAGGPSLTPLKSREGNAAGFPTAMPITPSNPNTLFSTINAETLEMSAQDVSFPLPEDKVRVGAVGGARGECVVCVCALCICVSART